MWRKETTSTLLFGIETSKIINRKQYGSSSMNENRATT
jgi:hypothetical protein